MSLAGLLMIFRQLTEHIPGGDDMARNILILGASYGSLLGTKLLMAGHNVTLVCRRKTADLINREGTEVRIKLRDEPKHRSIFSRDLPGKLDAVVPQDVDVSRYDLVGLAMQEPQYTNHTIRVLMVKIAAARLPCLSIMNMPPLPYLKRIPALAEMELEEAYTNAQVWERFAPGLVTLCSPDPQAFRPPEEAANVLHVGLATNFKAATFADEAHNKLLRELEADIDKVRLDGQDVPVKLKVFDSPFVPLAKWSMLLTGNYRCITLQEPKSIKDAVHGDLKLSQSIYEHVDAVARRLGADPQDQVPFEKYAKAAESLLKPSSAARAVAAGAPFIERVDLLVKLISHQLGAPNAEIDRTVQTVDHKLNEKIVEGGSDL
jgi:ketopantoate reductase PanE/ApbA-like protein